MHIDAGNATLDRLGDSFIHFSDGHTFHSRAHQYLQDGSLPPVPVHTLLAWFESYKEAVRRCAFVSGDGEWFAEGAFSTLMELMRRHHTSPIDFRPYHTQLLSPFDYYQFGVDFSIVLVHLSQSRVDRLENLHRAVAQANAGENVIFLSNHQSEADPYAIDALFNHVARLDAGFVKDIIFMAGDRVREDLVVVPFSAGRNLLTVYSKKHLGDVPELRGTKVAHNRRTISVTQRLLAEGGKCIWFAPSGGRDRRCAESGRVEVSEFDAGAIEMMRFTAFKSGKPCHFYPLSLVTYNMLPPPSNVGGAQIGEERIVNHMPMYLEVGDEIDWRDSIPEGVTGKMEKRIAQGKFVQRMVTEGYTRIGGYDL